MFRVIRLIVFSLFFIAACVDPAAAAWFFGEKPLATIDGEVYTSQDFKGWWKYWREDGSLFPESPEPFIDWQLLVKEAERMELDRQPSYKRKVEVFLKVRTLLLLKNEEIDSKISITDDQLKQYYEKEYSPQSHIQVLYFNDPQIAMQAAEDLRSGEKNMRYYKDHSSIHGSQVYYQEKKLRPKEIPLEWQGILAALEAGQVSQALAWKDGYVIFILQSRIWFDQEDFDSLKSSMEGELKKIREAELSSNLMENLKSKYQVQVDEQALADVDLYDPAIFSSEKPLVMSTRGTITVGQLVKKARSELQFFKDYGGDPQKIEQLKKRTLSYLLSQELITWASLDRHYEREEPLKESYQFYVRHRLVKELERLVFSQEIAVTGDEIAAFYNMNIEEFSQPERVDIAVMYYQGELIDRLWAEIVTGGDFFAVAEKYDGVRSEITQQMSDQLSDEMRKKIQQLAKGEVAEPFYERNRWVIVKLVDRQAASVEPMEVASLKISDTLKNEKFAQRKKDFLEQLKAKVSITVNQDVWQKLQEELAN
jgi:parvulin-like peptidyl-prolyl isomerase